jgi:hypothetical protein
MEKEKPHEGILHRELHIHDVVEHFQPQLDVLREVVNYGTNLIAAAFHSSSKQLADVILVPVLLKQVVSMLDAFEVLVSNACVSAAQLQSRAMFEASVYIDFIMLGNEEEKARYYYVSNLRRELTWALRSQEGSAEHAKFFAALGEFGDALQETQKATAEPAKAQAQEIQEFLSKEPWKSTNEVLDQAKGNKKYDVAWHEPFGKRSVRELSDLTGRLHEYEVFYSGASEKMHSSEYKSHISMSTISGEDQERIYRVRADQKPHGHPLSLEFRSQRRVSQLSTSSREVSSRAAQRICQALHRELASCISEYSEGCVQHVPQGSAMRDRFLTSRSTRSRATTRAPG